MPKDKDYAISSRGVQIPHDIHDDLFFLAGELEYQHKHKVALLPFLEAISQLLPEDLEPLLREADLLPE